MFSEPPGSPPAPPALSSDSPPQMWPRRRQMCEWGEWSGAPSVRFHRPQHSVPPPRPPPPPPTPPRPGMEPGAPTEPRCRLEPWQHYEPGPAVLCALGCVLGLLYGCVGHRCFKAIMFTSGLLLGSGTIFLLCYKERVLETRLSLEVSAGIALAIGALCGLVTALLRSVGLFSTGLLLGLLLAVAVLAAAAPLVPPLSPWVLVGVLLGPALLCALLALRWPKALTTLATAVLGAAVVAVCVDYFVEVFGLVLHVSERLRMEAVGQLCWYSWVVLGVWPALSLLGVLLQQRKPNASRTEPPPSAATATSLPQ
ncbi:transmembrane protein 198-like [Gallus gallus]|uniref:transmembrane protein 198-like n=1 Tax=Gallus gallus TaxID=9031 RepID=UPI001F02EED8|nr:transmembrane protein 198-like [Gallus gallus]